MGIVALMLAATPASAADAARPGSPRHLARRLDIQVRPRAATVRVAVAPGLDWATPFTLAAGDPPIVVRVPHRIGPDGTYDSYSDLVQSIEGTPCGQDCTRRSLSRWGYAPGDRSVARP